MQALDTICVHNRVVCLNFKIIMYLFPGSIQRWILSQPKKAAVGAQCEAMAGISSHEMNAEAGSASAKRNEDMVQSILSVVQGMVNPFDDNDELVSLSSGTVAPQLVCTDLLEAHSKGKQEVARFVTERLVEKSIDIFSPLSMLKLKDFSSKSTNLSASKAKAKYVAKDRALFSRLLVASQVRSLDLKDILTYSLYPEPLSLATDGCPNKTDKSKLIHALESTTDSPILEDDSLESPCAVMIDGMAVIQSLAKSELPNTFGELSDLVFGKVVKYLEHFKATRADFVIDNYYLVSIKNCERARRACKGVERIMIHGPNQKLPKQWMKYLGHGVNKTELLSFLYQQWSVKSVDNVEIFITNATSCRKLTNLGHMVVHELECAHEEADTRLLLHTQHAAQNGFKTAVIVSPDTDVAVIALGVLEDIDCKIAISCGKGKTRRIIDINKMSEVLGANFCKALPFLHSLTGCDSTSSFSGKGKKKVLSVLQNHPELQTIFQEIGSNENLADEQFQAIQKYVCQLYNASNITQVNEARYHLFGTGSTEHNLPPNDDCLKQHSKRAVYQAFIWRQCLVAKPTLPLPSGYGWQLDTVSNELSIIWRTRNVAPSTILQTVYCKCQKMACQDGRCSCRSTNLPCTDLCNCNKDICANVEAIPSHAIESSDDEF